MEFHSGALWSSASISSSASPTPSPYEGSSKVGSLFLLEPAAPSATGWIAHRLLDLLHEPRMLTENDFVFSQHHGWTKDEGAVRLLGSEVAVVVSQAQGESAARPQLDQLRVGGSYGHALWSSPMKSSTCAYQSTTLPVWQPANAYSRNGSPVTTRNDGDPLPVMGGQSDFYDRVGELTLVVPGCHCWAQGGKSDSACG